MSISLDNNDHLQLTIFLLVALFLAACGPSQVEIAATATQNAANDFATQTANAPTNTSTPTTTPTPTETPIPSPTITSTPTETSTEIPPKSQGKDTSDLYVLPGLSFLFPSGWHIQLMKPPDGYYQEMRPLHVFFSPEENPLLTFEITSISELGSDSNQALEQYSNLRIDFLKNAHPETEVINQMDFSTFSAEGISVSHQLEWIDEGSNLEGFALMGIDPTGSYGYMFEGVQTIGKTNLEQIVKLPWTSFFPLAVNRNSLYAPFEEKLSKFEFGFGYPADSQTYLSEFEGNQGQSSNRSNGRFTVQPPWEEKYSTYFVWFTPNNEISEKDLTEFLYQEIAHEGNRVEIISQGNLHLGNEYGQVTTTGRYIEIADGAGQQMIAAWQCPGDERLFIFHLENDKSKIGIETLYLFQRYLISFSCQ